jgi:hypothetical protein
MDKRVRRILSSPGEWLRWPNRLNMRRRTIAQLSRGVRTDKRYGSQLGRSTVAHTPSFVSSSRSVSGRGPKSKQRISPDTLAVEGASCGTSRNVGSRLHPHQVWKFPAGVAIGLTGPRVPRSRGGRSSDTARSPEASALVRRRPLPRHGSAQARPRVAVSPFADIEESTARPRGRVSAGRDRPLGSAGVGVRRGGVPRSFEDVDLDRDCPIEANGSPVPIAPAHFGGGALAE